MTSPHTLRILVVEDNADHAELILAALGDSPIKVVVTHVADGQQALDYLHRHGEYAGLPSHRGPELVLLDLRLPKVDGIEVLSRIRATETLHALPVVVLSTSSADHDVLAAYAHHCNSYLVKPMDCQTLSQLLASVLRYWATCNCLPGHSAGEVAQHTE